jgi:hypothetical protein
VNAEVVGGPALTAQMYTTTPNQGVGFPLYFESSDFTANTIAKFVGPNFTFGITAGPGQSVTIRLTATGNDKVNGGTVSSNLDITYYMYNRIMWGVTGQTSLTAGTLTGSWLTRNTLNSLDQTFILNVPIGEYIYFAYPKRLGEAVFQINDLGAGGFNAQGYGGVPGVSSHNWGNDKGFFEDYYIYRSTNSGLGNNTKIDTGSSLTDL